MNPHTRTDVHGVTPGQPADDYAQAPYPGERPAGSWVVDADARLWPVVVDPAAPSGWSVVGDGSGGEQPPVCLDAWLSARGAVPLAERIPVLSYGSNANPAKVVDNRVTLPAVNLAARVEGLASVYAAGTRGSDDAVVATLAARFGHVEEHVVTYAAPADFAPLDRAEGRRGHWYDLETLTTGRVTLANGQPLTSVVAYVGGRTERFPLVGGDGEHLLVSATTQAEAWAALGDLERREQSGAVLPEPEVIGTVWPLDVAVPQVLEGVFVYGTLMPGQSRWASLARYVDGAPVPATVAGTLHDTGNGYPALFPGVDAVPGYWVRLRASTRRQALERLDEIEGTAWGLYSREVISVTREDEARSHAWTYVACDPALAGTVIDAWATATGPH